MTRIVTPESVFEWVAPDSEPSFEQAIKANAKLIFGEGRHYLDCKRRIGAKGKKGNIPDAYLIDLRRNDPRLYVIENELTEHAVFNHMAVQILEFSLSYQQAGRQLRTVLFDEISKAPEIKDACEKFAKEKGYRNLDNLLDHLVFETPFQVIIIIDQESPELNLAMKKLSFPVEIIEVVTYEDSSGKKVYRFRPFLQDIDEVYTKAGKGADISELDTIVVPAREDGFNEVFLGQNQWYAVRIHSSMIPQIKHIAVYRISPISAITHVAPVNKIVPWKDTGKYCLEFAESPREIGPFKLDEPGPGKSLQGPRYTSMDKLMRAKMLSDVF